MYKFDKKKLSNFMEQHHHNPTTLAREFTLRNMDVNFRTIYRWRSETSINQPNATHLRVFMDIAKGLDKTIKFEDFFVKKWVDGDKIK